MLVRAAAPPIVRQTLAAQRSCNGFFAEASLPGAHPLGQDSSCGYLPYSEQDVKDSGKILARAVRCSKIVRRMTA